MALFSRALLAMDLSDTDQGMLRYFAFLQPIFDTRQVYFLHIMPDFVTPQKEEVVFQKLFNPEHPIDEKMREEITEQVEKQFGKLKNIALTVDVIEGKPYEKLIHWTKVKGIDLLVTGLKTVSEGSGITPRRVARHSECNILFVPKEAPLAIQQIIVPMDFSENSLRALRVAIDISREVPDSKIIVLHIVDLPSDSYYLRTSPDRGFVAMLRDTSQASFDRMLIDNGLDKKNISFEMVENHYLNIAAHITEFAETHAPDLLVLGAQGHSAFEHFLYGSVTERLVEKYREKPILIVR